MHRPGARAQVRTTRLEDVKVRTASILDRETARPPGVQAAQGKDSRMAKRCWTLLRRSVGSWRARRAERDTAYERGAAAGFYAATHRAFSRLGPPSGPKNDAKQ